MVRWRLASALALAIAPAAAHASQLSITTDSSSPPHTLTTFTYTADPGEANRLTVSYNATSGRIVFEDKGVQTMRGPRDLSTCIRTLPRRIACKWPGDWHVIVADLGDGNDVGAADFSQLAWYPYLDLHVRLNGGAGADRLSRTDGADSTVFSGGPGADDISGAGTFAVTYEDAPAGVEVTLDGVGNDGTPGEGDNVHPGSWYTILRGSAFDDVLVGHDGNDSIEGLGGSDRIDLLGGDDGARGDDGDDVIHGGDGNDRLDGHDGDDQVYGEAGDDQVSGGYNGADRLSCGDGDDFAAFDRWTVPDPDCERLFPY